MLSIKVLDGMGEAIDQGKICGADGATGVIHAVDDVGAVG
jgi:hypothetical protein